MRFVQWLSANERATLNAAWVTEIAKDTGKELANGLLGDCIKPATLKRLTEFDMKLPPLHFEQVATAMFFQWMHSLSIGFDVADSHRFCRGRLVRVLWRAHAGQVG